MKMTAAHMEACKTASSEVHNKREKELDYARADLSYLNESEILESISDRLTFVKAVYEKAVGQKMQKSAEPIQEVVLVVDESTTMAQVKEFGRLCQVEFGMTPFQYFIHKDEGHYEDKLAETGWKPNYHAHIVFDTTCYEHKMVLRNKKSNGKNLKDENGKPIKIEVDGYGKTIKFTKNDLSKMQDLAAAATGLERGIPSTKKHLTAMQFKCMQLLEELKENQAKVAEIQSELKKEKMKAAAADAGKAVFDAISNTFGGGKTKALIEQIGSLKDEIKQAKIDSDNRVEEIVSSANLREQRLGNVISAQQDIINTLTDLFPSAKNCVNNYQTLTKMGLSKEHIKQLMSGAVLLYTGKLKDPKSKEKYEVKDVTIELAESRSGENVPWIDKKTIYKFFSDLAAKVREALGYTKGMSR